MKPKIEVKPHGMTMFPHSPSHTHPSGGGLLDLPCIQGQLLIDAKLFSGTTKYQKKLIVSKNKPVWIT